MNTNAKLAGESIAAMNRQPERFLLVGSSQDWCEQARKKLQAYAKQLPGSFLAWRLKYGLLRVLPVDTLEEVLQQVLEPGEGQQPNVLRIWTTQSRQAWRNFAKGSQALCMTAAREATLSLIDEGENALPVDEIAQAANQPDVLARLNWLLKARTCPVPPECLALAALPELDGEKNAAMAQAGYDCYNTWAQALLDSYGAEVLEEFWGVSPDAEDEDTEAEAESQGDAVWGVPPLAKESQNTVSSIGDRLAAILANKNAVNDESFALAAASPTSQREEQPALRQWKLKPEASHGIGSLEMYIENNAIEFIGERVSGMAWVAEHGSICLVLQLPGPVQPVVLKRSDNKEKIGFMRFTWPTGDWPESWQVFVENPPLADEFKSELAKIKVAVM